MKIHIAKGFFYVNIHIKVNQYENEWKNKVVDRVTVAADLSAVYPWWDSPVPPHSTGARVDRHAQDTTVIWFRFGVLTCRNQLSEGGHGQQHYPDRLWRCSVGTKGPKACQENTPTASHHHTAWMDARQAFQFSSLLFTWQQITTNRHLKAPNSVPTSECHSRNKDSTIQSHANHLSFPFLYSAWTSAWPCLHA